MAQESGVAGGQAWEKRDSRGYGLVDKQTGEVVDAIPILVPRRQKLGTGFFMGIQEAFVALARESKRDKRDKNKKDEDAKEGDENDKDAKGKRNKDSMELSSDTWRVLFFLLGRLEYENHLRVGQGEIARVLEMHKSSVSRALKRLTERGILKPTGEMAGRSSFYTLDTQLAWRGKVRNRPQPPKQPASDTKPNGEPPATAAGEAPEAADTKG
ncbi:MAG TPA: helix-turn-helix domain-containing protein [Longimicrobium sp.]|nr:helix-turn-helix domain-containing protein [Longimicrobium sp.]